MLSDAREGSDSPLTRAWQGDAAFCTWATWGQRQVKEPAFDVKADSGWAETLINVCLTPEPELPATPLILLLHNKVMNLLSKRRGWS